MNKIIVYHILLALYWTFTFTFPVRLALYISIKDISSSQYEDFDPKWKFYFSDILVHFHISDNFDSFFQIILQLGNFALFFLPSFFAHFFCPLFLPSLCPPAAVFAWFMWYCHCPPSAPILPFAKRGQKEGSDNIIWTMQKRTQEGIKRAKKRANQKL